MNQDIFFHISQFSAPLDFYHFSLTCSYHFLFYKKLIFNRINSRLRKNLKNEFNAFMQLMRECRCVISGSFVIQCILDEKWHNSDIDIYVSHENETGATDGGYPKSKMDDFMFNTMKYDGCADSYGDICETQIRWVRDYHGKGETGNDCIQIIGINISKNYESIRNFIYENFDLDICKNIYYYDGKFNLSCLNIYDILSKQTKFNFSHSLESSMHRYHKYIGRGVDFENKSIFTLEQLDKIYLVPPPNIKDNLDIKYLSYYTPDPIIFNKAIKIYQVGKTFDTDNCHRVSLSSYDGKIHNMYTTDCHKMCCIKLIDKSIDHSHIHVCINSPNWDRIEYILINSATE